MIDDEQDCRHAYVNGVCQAGCNGLEPLPGDVEVPRRVEFGGGGALPDAAPMREWKHRESGVAVRYSAGDPDVVVIVPVGALAVDRPLVHRDEHDEVRLPRAVLAAFARHLVDEGGA